MSTIRVAVYRPAERVAFEEIENDLPPMQEIVEGHIEPLFLPDGLVVVFNDDHDRLGLPPNRFVVLNGLRHGPLYGTFFVARREGSEFASIRPEDEIDLAQWGPLQGWRA